MKKNGFCRAAMAGTALFLSIAVFPSQAAETGPGFEEAVEDTYDGPESPLEAAKPADKAMEAEPAKTSGGPRKPAEDASGMADGSQEAPSSKVTETEPEETTVPGRSYGTFKISAYCGCEACSGGHLYTYSGAVPKEDHTISADLDQFPLGTKLLIDGIIYTVEDKGSGVVENHLDIYFDTHKEALDYGSRRWRYLRQSRKPNRSIKKEGPCHPGFPSSFLSLFTDP